MGQESTATAPQSTATVDLLDPTKDAAVTGANPLASADDLLAQLAGEEIDRLLANDDAAATPQAVGNGDGETFTQVEATVEAEAAVAAELDAILTKAAATAPAEISPEPMTPAAEMRALLQDSEKSDAAEPATQKPSTLIRILELLNSPLNRLPGAAREAVGKIAVLTLFNAVAVILYVLIFRRH